MYWASTGHTPSGGEVDTLRQTGNIMKVHLKKVVIIHYIYSQENLFQKTIQIDTLRRLSSIVGGRSI
jgi:hypothetical protein